MTAKAKIEGLTSAWYGFALVSTLVSLLSNGLGIFSIITHSFSLMIGFVLTYLFGRALLKKSSFTRMFLVIVSAVFTVLWVLASARAAWGFLQSWSLSYVIAADPADSDALWVTEVWDSPASHHASSGLPAVKAAIARGRPFIAGFSNRVETIPIGGFGLPRAASS